VGKAQKEQRGRRQELKGHLRERGKGNWWAVVDIGRDPETGKRRQKWHKLAATGKREAQKELAKLLADLAGGTYVEPGKLTVGEYLEKWLADYAQPNVAAKTYMIKPPKILGGS